MMNAMTDPIRQEIRLQLVRLRRSQTDLAEKVGVSPQYMSRLLSGNQDGSVDVWRKLVEELELALTVKPKSG